jgi:RNA polymerase sigma factor (sigma-70 family)
LTEKELIEGCVRKDTRCQRALFERYAGTMLSVCRRYASDQKEAEDMLQETFIRVFSYVDQFKFQGSLEGWIKRITVNASLRVLQNKKVRFSEIKEDHHEYPTVDAFALSSLGAAELLKLISHLPDGYRTVFNLYAIEGYTHEEIADLLHIKPASSRSQLSKARSLLKEQITSRQKITS